MPTDAQYITGDVPPEMRDGLVTDEMDLLGVKVEPSEGLTRVTIPRPANIPAANPTAMPPGFGFTTIKPAGALTYDFPLLPGVQAHIALVGEPTADHLEQLVDYLTVACRRLREQEKRDAQRVMENTLLANSSIASSDRTAVAGVRPVCKRSRKQTGSVDRESPDGGKEKPDHAPK